jgi:hypothetical protein
MRSLLIYPWQLREFLQWVRPDVSAWTILNEIPAHFEGSYDELIAQDVIPALSQFDYLRWFEDGRLIGVENDVSTEIENNFKDYRFNGLFYSGLFDTEGEAE